MPCTNFIIESSNLSKLDKKFSDKLKTFCFVKTVSTVKLSLTFAKDFAILALFFSHLFIINPYKNLLILFFFSTCRVRWCSGLSGSFAGAFAYQGSIR